MSKYIRWLQHVPFEGLGSIAAWLQRRDALIAYTRPYVGERLPAVESFDWLIVMGGPMSVNDEKKLPWLVDEKALVAAAIASGKTVLGVCLGAQMIAAARGARVFKNAEREIGWFPVERVAEAAAHPLAAALPERIEAFHWHGETFDLPGGAVHLARSEGCAHQAFALGDRVLGLQYHLETTPYSAGSLVENCRDEMTPSRYVQDEATVLERPERFAAINKAMGNVLQALWDATAE